MIANADYVVDMGPGGGAAGGTIVATGTPADIAAIHGEHHRALSRTWRWSVKSCPLA